MRAEHGRGFRVAQPQLVALGPEQKREAVALLAELLLDAASKRAVVSAGGLGGASTGASGGVVPFPWRAGKARRAGMIGPARDRSIALPRKYRSAVVVLGDGRDAIASEIARASRPDRLGPDCARPSNARTVRRTAGSNSAMEAIRHVLAIYRATSTGRRTIREASAIATEHGAQLTIAVVVGDRTRCGSCAISADRWDAVVFEGALQDLDDAHFVVGQAGAHLAIIEGSGPRVIADAAERMRCDVVVVPVARFSPRGGLARALRRRTRASVIGVRRR